MATSHVEGRIREGFRCSMGGAKWEKGAHGDSKSRDSLCLPRRHHLSPVSHRNEEVKLSVDYFALTHPQYYHGTAMESSDGVSDPSSRKACRDICGFKGL